jgi:hypothetical protein
MTLAASRRDADSGRTPTGTPVITRGGDPAEVEALRQAFVRLRANRAVLEEAWPRLLREHLHEWVAVFGEGTLVTANMENIRAMIPDEAIAGAIVRYVEKSDMPLIL